MKFTAELIFPAESAPDRLGGEAMAAIAREAEELGFDAISFNDHPAPSRKWLEAGGHDAHDPIAILGFCAAVTSRIRLIPYQLVLPYRNPFLVAKAFASLDVLSNGRAVASVCLGYLRSEFAAMGVPFDERNRRFDEALDVIQAVWTRDSVRSAGLGYEAIGQVSTPRPLQRPHPPIWIGGNSRLSRERVARAGQGWAPILNTEQGARTTRTALMKDYADLERSLDELRELTHAAGRDPAQLEIQLNAGPFADRSTDAQLDHVARLEALGATQYLMPFFVGGERDGRAEMHRFAEEVLAAWNRSQ